MDAAVTEASGLMDGRRWHRARQIVPELLAILACVVAIWAAVLFTLWQARMTAIDAASQQIATLSHAFAESSERMAAAVDRQLLSLRSGIAEKGDAFDLLEWERTQSSPDRMTLQLGFTNREGLLLQTTADMGGRQINLADRDHFRVHLDPDQDIVFISAPVVGRLTNKCSVQFSRKLLDHQGHFAGVGIISVGCDDLSQFYGTVDLGGGFAILVGLDGIIRGYGPARPGVLGVNLRDVRAFASVFTAAEGTLTAPVPWDDVGRLIGFRRLEQYPLIMLVGFDGTRIFRQYRPMRDRALAIGAGATVIIILLGGVWIQQRMRSAASRQALLLTLDNMSQGIVMIDAQGRIPVANRRAIELLDLPPAWLSSTRRLGHPEATALGLLVSDATIARGSVEPGTIHKNGRIIEAVTQHLSGGGQVRTFTDVTERRIADTRIRHMAHHDALTGLANRGLLNERIGELCRRPGGGPRGRPRGGTRGGAVRSHLSRSGWLQDSQRHSGSRRGRPAVAGSQPAVAHADGPKGVAGTHRG